jgi:hypothetical protein
VVHEKEVAMNWKSTAVLAALLAVSLGVYFGWNPAPPVLTKEERKLLETTANTLDRIEIARRGEAPLLIERAKDAVGEFWRLSPSGRPADPAAVQKMIYGLDRFSKTSAADVSLSAAGLEAPRTSVTFHAAGRKETVRIGGSSPTNTESIFVQLEGDPKVYRIDKDTAESYDRPAADLRSKQLVRYVPHKATGLEMRFRFTVRRQNEPPKVEYEESTIERVETGIERGWWLTKPYREKLDDRLVNRFVSDLASIQVEAYEADGDLKAKELDQPELLVSVRLHETPHPVSLEFGGPAERGKRRWVRIPGSGEVALIPESRYTGPNGLPRQRGDLRSRVLYSFSKDQVRTLEIEADGLGRLLIERKETKREGDPVPTVSWDVLEPKGVRIRKERVEPYVRDVLSASIEQFVGATDFGQIKQDSALVTMTVETTDGKKQRVLFKAAGNNAWGQKEGIQEVFEVLPSYVKLLQLLELAVTPEEVFSVPRTDLRRIEFDAKFAGNLQPIRYILELDPRTGKWGFADPAFKGTEADPQKVTGFLTMLSYIGAEQGRWVGRDPATLGKYRLNDLTAPARLTLWHEGGPKDGVTILISDNQSSQPGSFMYFARRADGPAVFRMVSQIVETLKQVPVKKD